MSLFMVCSFVPFLYGPDTNMSRVQSEPHYSSNVSSHPLFGCLHSLIDAVTLKFRESAIVINGIVVLRLHGSINPVAIGAHVAHLNSPSLLARIHDYLGRKFGHVYVFVHVPNIAYSEQGVNLLAYYFFSLFGLKGLRILLYSGYIRRWGTSPLPDTLLRPGLSPYRDIKETQRISAKRFKLTGAYGIFGAWKHRRRRQSGASAGPIVTM